MLKEKYVDGLLLLIIYIKNVSVGYGEENKDFFLYVIKWSIRRPNIAPQILKLKCWYYPKRGHTEIIFHNFLS